MPTRYSPVLAKPFFFSLNRFWSKSNQNQEKIEDEDEKHETSEVDLRWFWFDFDQNRFNEKKNDLASTVAYQYTYVVLPNGEMINVMRK